MPSSAARRATIGPEPVSYTHLDVYKRQVLDGGFAPATAANPRPHGMPPFGQLLNDNDIAMLVSYIRNSWGNEAGGVTPLEVKRARAASTRN